MCRFLLRIFMPEHKYPMMTHGETALMCRFFTSDIFCRGTALTSGDLIAGLL